MKLFFALLLVTTSALAQEYFLLQDCGKKDLDSCEKLGTLYLGQEKWDKAYLVGEALCTQDRAMGCMLAGTSLLAQKKIKEATPFLQRGCDGFEPYSCRSLGRLMEKADENITANMYFKRACFYGLKEVCEDVRDTRIFFSSAAIDLIKKMKVDCLDTKTEACVNNLEAMKVCALPLNKQDCELLAHYSSLFFRAKFIQAEAKLVLMNIATAQKLLKEKTGSYSYDLKKILKDQKLQPNYHYVFGFKKSCVTKYVKGGARATSRSLHPELYKWMGPKVTTNVLKVFEKGASDECYDQKSGYEAYAVTNLDPTKLDHVDVWKIDQDMKVENLVDGLPLP